jgi:hypothetical protein
MHPALRRHVSSEVRAQCRIASPYKIPVGTPSSGPAAKPRDTGVVRRHVRCPPVQRWQTASAPTPLAHFPNYGHEHNGTQATLLISADPDHRHTPDERVRSSADSGDIGARTGLPHASQAMNAGKLSTGRNGGSRRLAVSCRSPSAAARV